MKLKQVIKESWKNVVGYEGLYKVSNLGKVKSLQKIVKRKAGKDTVQKERILKPGLTHGYHIVVLRKNNTSKTFYVHRIVVAAFKKLEKFNVDHDNEIRTDNRLSNLKVKSQRQNIISYFKRRKHSSKFTGVTWSKGAKKWQAAIYIKPKNKHLGLFHSEKEASLAYQRELKRIQ